LDGDIRGELDGVRAVALRLAAFMSGDVLPFRRSLRRLEPLEGNLLAIGKGSFALRFLAEELFFEPIEGFLKLVHALTKRLVACFQIDDFLIAF